MHASGVFCSIKIVQWQWEVTLTKVHLESTQEFEWNIVMGNNKLYEILF